MFFYEGNDIYNNFALVTEFQSTEKEIEDKTKEEIIAGAIEIMDPMFEHPYAWNNYPTDVLQEIKSMWGIV